MITGLYKWSTPDWRAKETSNRNDPTNDRSSPGEAQTNNGRRSQAVHDSTQARLQFLAEGLKEELKEAEELSAALIEMTLELILQHCNIHNTPDQSSNQGNDDNDMKFKKNNNNN